MSRYIHSDHIYPANHSRNTRHHTRRTNAAIHQTDQREAISAMSLQSADLHIKLVVLMPVEPRSHWNDDATRLHSTKLADFTSRAQCEHFRTVLSYMASRQWEYTVYDNDCQLLVAIYFSTKDLRLMCSCRNDATLFNQLNASPCLQPCDFLRLPSTGVMSYCSHRCDCPSRQLSRIVSMWTRRYNDIRWNSLKRDLNTRHLSCSTCHLLPVVCPVCGYSRLVRWKAHPKCNRSHRQLLQLSSPYSSSSVYKSHSFSLFWDVKGLTGDKILCWHMSRHMLRTQKCCYRTING